MNQEDTLKREMIDDLRKRREKAVALVNQIDRFLRELTAETVTTSTRFKGFKWLHDVIAIVLHENGGRLTAKEIMEHVVAGGRLDDVEEPSGAILKSLRTNEKFGKFVIERVGPNREPGDTVQLQDIVTLKESASS